MYFFKDVQLWCPAWCPSLAESTTCRLQVGMVWQGGLTVAWFSFVFFGSPFKGGHRRVVTSVVESDLKLNQTKPSTIFHI